MFTTQFLNTTLIIALFSCVCKYTFSVNVQFVIIKYVEMIYIRKLIRILGEYCHHSVYLSTMSLMKVSFKISLSLEKKRIKKIPDVLHLLIIDEFAINAWL
jgi:hypothetical protein